MYSIFQIIFFTLIKITCVALVPVAVSEFCNGSRAADEPLSADSSMESKENCNGSDLVKIISQLPIGTSW